jgi:hypothetical protein
VAWVWTDTLADLLETIDRVDPEALRALRDRPVAYRLDDGADALGLARSVLSSPARVPQAPRRTSGDAAPGRSRSSRLV